MTRYKLTHSEKLARYRRSRNRPKRVTLSQREAEYEHKLGLIRLEDRDDTRDDESPPQGQ